MRSATARLGLLLLFATSFLRAQDIAGHWQANLGADNQKLRVILVVEKADGDALKGRIYSIDQTTDPMVANTISFHDGVLTFSIDAVHVSYEGKLDPSGNAIIGTFTQGKATPLTFERATPTTAWDIDPTPPSASLAIREGVQRYDTIKNVPILAIFADPHDLGNALKDNPKARAAMEASDARAVENQAKAFETQVPNAKVVRIPHANHYVFRSNEADVLREMNAFITTLPN
jgi:hypothetical protein